MSTTQSLLVSTIEESRQAWWEKIVDPFLEPKRFLERKSGSWGLLMLVYSAAIFLSGGYYLTTGSMQLQKLYEVGELTMTDLRLCKSLQFVETAMWVVLFPLLLAAPCWFLSWVIVMSHRGFSKKLAWINVSHWVSAVPFFRVFFVCLWGELLFSGGLLFRLVFVKRFGPDFSFSLREIAIRSGVAESLQTYLLSKIDFFMIWEIIVVAIGLRSLFHYYRFWAFSISITVLALPILMQLYRLKVL